MTWEVDADGGLEAVRLPPLLVQPLVENAVLHGIEPAAAGGARRGVRGFLRRGACASGSRTAGSASIRRQRATESASPTCGSGLRASFGERARLTLSETAGGGVSAELRIPAGAAANARAE